MGAVFGLFAGFYYWIGKITGKQYNELLGFKPKLNILISYLLL